MAHAKQTPAAGLAAGANQKFSFGDEHFQVAEAAPKNQSKKSGGRSPRDKGSRLERAIVPLLQDAGLGAERVPLSGSAGGSYLGDLTVPASAATL